MMLSPPPFHRDPSIRRSDTPSSVLTGHILHHKIPDERGVIIFGEIHSVRMIFWVIWCTYHPSPDTRGYPSLMKGV